MSEINRISDQLKRAYMGEAWHGPSVCEVISDIDPAMAAAYPLQGVHSIWEIVLHMVAWIKFARLSLEEKAMPQNLPPEKDWPVVQEASQTVWESTLKTLEKEHRLLLDRVSKLKDSELSKIVPGRNYSVYFLLHGIIQHNLYHAGQMSLLKTALKKNK
jgi:uncharacterized damage-inducible protein DinB